MQHTGDERKRSNDSKVMCLRGKIPSRIPDRLKQVFTFFSGFGNKLIITKYKQANKSK